MMKRYQSSWAMYICVVLSLVQPAWAADDNPPVAPKPEQIFKELDKDSDGQLTSDEVGEDRQRFFERLVRIGDQNDDGQLSIVEFQKASRPDDRPVEAARGNVERGGGDRSDFDERFKLLDSNCDGKITREEVPERAKPFLNPLFDRLGKDEMTKEEFLKARGQLGNQGRGPGAENGIPGGGTPEEFFTRLDTNSDGKLTLDEAPDRGRPFVERLLNGSDKGKDGSVSKEEFLAAMSRLKGVGRGENSNRGRPEAKRPGQDERKPEGGRMPDGRRKPEGDRRGSGEPKSEGAPRDGGRGPDAGGRRPLPRFFEKLDANSDGRISTDEFSKAPEFFKDLDENSDGHLDPRELLGPPPREGEDRDRPAAE